MVYIKQNWQDLPAQTTPISADRLNHLETQYDEAKAYTDSVVQTVPSSGSLVQNLTYPLWISHRGGLLCYPEASMEAYQASADAGFMLEVDVRALSDGTLVCIHDATTNRTMDISASVGSLTLAQWRAANVKAPSRSGRVEGSGRGTPVVLAELLSRFGGNYPMIVEIKESNTAQQVISLVKELGLIKDVILSSTSMTVTDQVVEAGGFANVLTDNATPSEMVSRGVSSVGVSKSATASYINSCTSAGLKVFKYTVNTRPEAVQVLSEGCSGIISDDPWETSRTYPPETSLNLENGFIPHAVSHSRGRVDVGEGTTQKVTVSNDALEFNTKETASVANCLRLGSFGFGGPSAKLRFWVQSLLPVQTTSPEASWFFGIYLGWQEGEVAVNEEPGKFRTRLAMVRRDGRKHVYNVPTVGSSVTQLGSTPATTPPYAPAGKRGVPMLFEVEFTSTTVAIRNLTLGDTDLEVTHTAWTGSDLYLSLNVLGANSNVWGITCVR